jgi:hypothetical protein
LYIGIACHHDERNGQTLLSQPLQQVDAVLVGQTQVGQNQVGTLCFQMFLGAGDTADGSYLKAFFA